MFDPVAAVVDDDVEMTARAFDDLIQETKAIFNSLIDDHLQTMPGALEILDLVPLELEILLILREELTLQLHIQALH